jgi:hypothetical protein
MEMSAPDSEVIKVHVFELGISVVHHADHVFLIRRVDPKLALTVN